MQITSPLKWPGFLAPTERLAKQNNPQFQMNMQERDAVIFVEDEVNRTPQVISAVLSCDAININSTAPTQYLSKNTGAALEITLESGRFQIGCDRWNSLAHNIYVLHLALRYFRQLEEWGVAPLTQSLSSFRISSSAGSQAAAAEALGLKEWQIVLGLGPTATLDDANAIYRNRAKLIGESNPQELLKLNTAIQQARGAL